MLYLDECLNSEFGRIFEERLRPRQSVVTAADIGLGAPDNEIVGRIRELRRTEPVLIVTQDTRFFQVTGLAEGRARLRSSLKESSTGFQPVSREYTDGTSVLG